MMKVIILTSSEKGSASYHLRELVKSKDIEVVGVVLSEANITNKKRYYKRKIKKFLKIGIFGALNGIRMRKWYSNGVTELLEIKSIRVLCELHNIPFYKTPTINSSQTIEFFKSVNSDLGVSLGNGYIGSKVFSIPKRGMINIHHEVLPEYQNAQSIIWQLYNNSTSTGYTIHKIDKHIDTGEILYTEAFSIVFKENLEKTVSYNYAKLWKKSGKGLINVLENFESFFENSEVQGHGNSYTTPNLRQFLRIFKNFKELKRKKGKFSIR